MRYLKIDENYALNAKKGAQKFQKRVETVFFCMDVLAAKSVVGLLSNWATLWKMREKKTFHISRKPVVPVAETEKLRDLGNSLGLQRSYGRPRVLAIARDPWTIFAYWNVDWVSIFKKAAPVDRAVHLRIHCADNLEEKEATIEPMAGVHCATLSQRHRTCCIEIGFYQPADAWHMVAISNEITMPATETSESERVDLATIPFHLSFQQLVDLYGGDDNALAAVISRLQTRAVSSARHETLSSKERKILDQTGVAISEIADSRRSFNENNTEKLKKRAEALIRTGATSPSRGFNGDWTSAGS
jgi:hypothetical protein